MKLRAKSFGKKRRQLRLSLLFAAAGLLAGTRAFSHHSVYAQYSAAKPLDISGTVVGVRWANPHAFVDVRATVDGQEVVYQIELEALSALKKQGWTGNELKPGDSVRVADAFLEAKEGSTQACCARIYDGAGNEIYTDPTKAPGPSKDSGSDSAR